MKSKTWLILLTLTVVLLLAYSGKFTSSYFSDGESSINNTLRVKAFPLFGWADSFVILAGAGITNTGTTNITGDVGTFPTTTETGFGGITLTGTNHAGDNVTQQAKNDLVIAYNDAAGRTPFITVDGDTLGGRTLTPGVYRGGALDLTGTLILSGNATDVWIFQAASSLTTATNSRVILSGTAKAANVYWQVTSSATLGENSTFKGNILAYAAITLYNGAALEGRALTQIETVTLNANIITKPAP